MTDSPKSSARFVQFLKYDRSVLLLSITLQLVLGLLFGHAYDTRIFMATGYLVSAGQDPYIARDLSAVFTHSAFKEMTSVGYFPPWPLVTGLIYQGVYAVIPNILLYNLALKVPVIAANLGLAYLVVYILRQLGVKKEIARKAWVFLLLNPFSLYFIAAWGQFDSLVALCALSALVLLDRQKLNGSAILLALAISLKPTPLALFPVALIYLLGKSYRQVIQYSIIFSLSVFLFCFAPFFLFGWDATPILQNWNAHFTVGGAMSFMSFYELLADTYVLPGQWWLLGLAWVPALGIGLLTLKGGIHGFVDLLKKSLGLVLIFYLTRTWLSEPNITLLLPLVVILTSMGELDPKALAAVWILPLVFTFFNFSPPQLLFPFFPDTLNMIVSSADGFRPLRLVARSLSVIPWLIAGWWIVRVCLRKGSSVSQWK